jgi:Uncharacterized conserved protein
MRREEFLTVGGMSCSGCELRIEEKLKSLPGVVEVSASFSKGKVRVLYNDEKINNTTICKAISELGYTVKEDEKTQRELSGSKDNTSFLFGTVLVLAALYVIIQHTVGFGFINFIPQINQNMSYGILFVVGLFTSIHCLAMCGGINLSQCVAYQSGETEPSAKKRLTPSLLYNLGRVISYTVIGGIVGAIGSVVSFSGTAKAVVTVLSGVFMLVMGLNMLHVFPWLQKINIRMPKFIGKKLYSGKSKRGPFYVGLLNGLMPCGPLQAMQLYALGTGSFFAGAFSMLMFSLGTVPLMFAFGAVSTLLSSKFTHKMMQVSAVLVMMLGVLMTGRGLTLSGVQIGTTAQAAVQNTAKVTGSVQEVTSSFENGYYVPIAVKKGIPVKWTIKVKESDLNGCNNPVTIPKYGIQKKLVPGDNVIEFTPEDTGTITYTCWMGMIRSTITVVNNDSELAAANSAQSSAGVQAQQQQPNCCTVS